MSIPRRFFRYATVVLFVLFSAMANAGPPVALECPCSVSRINPTLIEIDFNLVFTKNIRRSGPIRVHLRGHANRDATYGGYYELAQSEIESMPFASTPTPISMRLPFYASGFDSGYLSLVLVDATSAEIFDITPLTAQPISVSMDAGAVFSAEFGEIFFEDMPKLEVSDNSYALSAINFTNRSETLVSEQLTLKLRASNLNSFYLLDEQEFTVAYDSLGKANLNLQGLSNSSLNGLLSYAPEHKYLQIGLFRAGQELLSYTLATLDDSPLPDYAFDLRGLDTLVDSDADGVSDYVELLRGSPLNSPESQSIAELETAFLYGDAALEYYGSEADIAAQLSHMLAVANQAYEASGLNIKLIKSALVNIGNDTAISNNDLLTALSDRVWPFRLVDSLLPREPDFIVHLNTLSYRDSNGGVAWLNGMWNDGVIDIDDMALRGTNTAVVDMDNTALTLVHEVGHLMGLDHSRRQVQGGHFSSFPWALGHGEDAEFVTIMSYTSTFSGAPQMALFSSPELVCSDFGSSCGQSVSDSVQGADAVSALKSVAYQWSAIANGFTPILTLNGANPLVLEPGAVVINPGATGFDSEDGDISANINFIQTLAIDNPEVDYLQTYSLSDSDGNTSSVVRQVLFDRDTDGDGVYNSHDDFPEDSLYSIDSDNDGLPDLWETQYGLNPNDSSDALSDMDVDGFTAIQEFAAGTVPIGSLDIDGNGQYDGLTDGMLLLRYMFGFTGEQLINGAVAADALYKSAETIQARINGLGDRIDVDDNQQIDALTDGLIILRYLLDFHETALINHALSADGARLDALAIQMHLDSLKRDN